MNLFWKNLFGGLASTDKFERQMKQLADDMRRYTQVEKSAELAEYNELAHVVNAPEFQEKKNTLENRRYRDTEEYRDRRKVKKLAARADIRQYYDVLRSQELKDFLAFMETPEAQHLNDRKAARKSPELQRFRRFAASKAYRVYTRLHDSYLIKEYEALLEKVASDEFQEADRFWSDPHRWQHTPEYQQEQRYNTLAANPDTSVSLPVRRITLSVPPSSHSAKTMHRMHSGEWTTGTSLHDLQSRTTDSPSLVHLGPPSPPRDAPIFSRMLFMTGPPPAGLSTVGVHPRCTGAPPLQKNL